jgi:Golgi phosphoprotein 3 GPP34
MDLAGGVAVRLSALCLDRRGRPAEWLVCSDAVRAGLLLDLALAGRISNGPDSIEIESTPTGFPPADRLLAAVAVEPERSLDGWLAERRLGLRDLVEANVGTGRWQQRRLRFRRDRYRDLRPDQTERDRARSATTTAPGWTPDDACVTAVAAGAGLLDRRLGTPLEPATAVVDAAGPAAWLCRTAVEHLLQAARRYRAQAGALRVADTVGPG